MSKKSIKNEKKADEKKADDIFKKQKVQPLESKTLFLPTSYNNNIFDVDETEEEQNQYNHPYYADKNFYPDKQYIQKPKTSLSTPNHNPIPFMINNNYDDIEVETSVAVPSSVQTFIDQLFTTISELINELISTNKNSTIEEIANKFTKNNRLFYIGVVLLLLFVARYVLSGIFG